MPLFVDHPSFQSFFLCTWGPIYGSCSLLLRETPCWDFTDVTLPDEDTNSLLTENANRAIQGNVAMHVTEPGGQIWVPWGDQILN